MPVKRLLAGIEGLSIPGWQVIAELLAHKRGGMGLPSTYAALMAACEKAGQWDLALALFDKMSAQVRA